MSPTATIITAVVTLAALVFAIFGASWLHQRNIERLLEQMERRFDDRFNQLEKRFDDRLNALEKRMDDRFISLEQRVERIERQLEAIFKPVLPK